MKNDLLKKAFDLIDGSGYHISNIRPDVFAETRRVMTSDVSAFEGKFSFKRSPYMREPLNRLSPDDPARIVAVMAGSQIGKTSNLIENGICWAISECPAPMIYIGGGKGFTIENASKRLEQAIDSFGIRNLIRPNTQRKTNKRSGDTVAGKEFPGGWLIIEGLNNPDQFRSRSLMYGFVDEFDIAKMTDAREGSFRKLLENRFTQYAFKMKLFYISTPTIKGQSNIEAVFLLGDQRRYYIPCPECGDFIEIKWREKLSTGEWAGIHFETDSAGKLIDKSVGYVCQSCGKFWTERYKYEILESEVGQWRPTAEPSEPGFFSYTAPSLLAPIGAYNWNHYIRDFLECYPQGLSNKPDISKLKPFINTCLAQTFEERGRAPKITQLSMNTRGYKIGEVPCKLSEEDGNGMIAMLTCACDMNGTEDDARLDYEVRAHAENGSTYSIDHGSIGTFQRGIKGDHQGRQILSYRNNEPGNVWDVFFEQVLKRPYKTDKGGMMNIFAAAVDTGFLPERAYAFIDKHAGEPVPVLMVAIKGEEERIRKLNIDHANYRKSKENPRLYLLEVNQIKDTISERMDLKWSEDSGYRQPAGFMNFPQPADDKYNVKSYFSQYEGEHKVEQLNADGTAVGYTWKKRHSTVSNHYWDCCVYNMAVRDIFADAICREIGIKDPSWFRFCEQLKKSIG